MAQVRSLPAYDPRYACFEIDGLPGGASRTTFDANVELDQSGQAWLPAVLPIVMSSQDRATFNRPLDPVGVSNSVGAQAVLEAWHPSLHRVAIEGETAAPGAPAEGVGCFFSGGVDSFYSALTLEDEITDLIFVHGFDIAIDDEQLASNALDAVRAAADDLGKRLIVVRTDIRRMSDHWAEWGSIYHGPALAAVGLLLGDHLGRVIIPSTFHVGALQPWGSHPELDPLWSTTRVRFEHHGLEATRTEKIEMLASSPVALEHLRVCWQQKNGEYNCGRCSKCVRTMAALRAFDALERCRTLPSRIDAGVLRDIRDPRPYDVVDARSILQTLARRRIREPELRRELRGLVLRDSRTWRALRRARAWARRLVR